jgi:hypothetical protein
MEKIINLLNQVGTINNKNNEILEATGSRFNMFQICGVNHYENTHSAIIAEFLNPRGTHGLKSKLLECFIETLGNYFAIHDFNIEKARVRTEYSTEYGRIDILIEDNQKKAIIIENKIYAQDQPEQLKRYNKFAEQTYKNGYQIFYLTLFGEEATNQSCQDVDYKAISHKENIINWLEKCIAITSRFPIVRETIIQYVNHLKQLTNQDMDAKNKEEITAILSKIDNLRAAKVIYQNYTNSFNYIAEKYFNPKMQEFAEQNDLKYNYECSAESFIKFYLSKGSWNGRCWIGFTFEANRCFFGICNNPEIDRIPNEIRIILHNNLKELGISNIKESNWWPFYEYFPNLTLEIWENDIINSDNFFNDCKVKIEKIIKALHNTEI